MFPQHSPLAERLSSGGVAVGSLTLLQEPALPEILGGAGLDFLIIDMEHAPADEHSVVTMIRSAEAARVTPLVRIRHVEEKEILWCLDAGAGGLVLPLVETAAEAELVAQLTHYPPVGSRTLCSASRAAGHGTVRHDFNQYLSWANEALTNVCLIETPEGLDNLESILEHEVEVAMIGRADLSLKLGLGYAPNHPQVVEIARDFSQRVQKCGRAPGILAYSIDEAQQWIAEGYRFIVYSQPEMILADAYRNALTSLRG